MTIRGKSVPVKSITEKPRDDLGSQNAIIIQQNAEKVPILNKIAKKKTSKIENLKLFWENRGGQDSDDITTPKFCGSNGSETVPRNFVLANTRSSLGISKLESCEIMKSETIQS